MIRGYSSRLLLHFTCYLFWGGRSQELPLPMLVCACFVFTCLQRTHN
nr:hypothetical protein Iba_chr01dCG11280 [Ipomoea batatas]